MAGRDGYERYTVVLCVRYANGRTQRARTVSPSLQWSHHGRTHLLRPFLTRNSVCNPFLRVYVYRYSCIRYPRACGKFPVVCNSNCPPIIICLGEHTCTYLPDSLATGIRLIINCTSFTLVDHALRRVSGRTPSLVFLWVLLDSDSG